MRAGEMLNSLSEPSKRAMDASAWILAAVASVSFWQGVALAVTILSGVASFILACVRIYQSMRRTA